MRPNIYITLLLFLLVTGGATAQKVTFKGRITDENHKPVEVASIGVSGEAKGTVADLNGYYSLTCESKDSITLIYSMVGYQTRKRTFKNPTDTLIVNVTLPSMNISLQQVDVVDNEKQMGGTQKNWATGQTTSATIIQRQRHRRPHKVTSRCKLTQRTQFAIQRTRR